MGTETTFKPTSTINDSLMGLPILKHFNQDEIATKIGDLKGGAKGIFGFLKLAIIGAFGWAAWKYIIPPVFKAAGAAIGGVVTFVIILTAIVASPVIFKAVKRFSRWLHKKVIDANPFAELEDQKGKMLTQKQVFTQSKGRIDGLQREMEIEANKSEQDVKEFQQRILSLDAKAKAIKQKMDDMVVKMGQAAKSDDAYVALNSDLMNKLSESQRVNAQLNQAKNFISKYGTRALIMKKLSQKLVMVGTSMDNKILDFDVTVDMLKKDYAFASKARAATDAAKSALGFTKSWELEYAMEVVTSTIASDIAATAGNLKDIDSITTQYTIDSDELYSNLDTLANNIRTGKDVVPDASMYNNTEYQLTTQDKMLSGGLDTMFN